MCGRYQLDLPGHTLASMFDAQLGAGMQFGGDARTWNAAPTQHLPILLLGSEGHRVLDAARWGIVPGWARGAEVPPRAPINARVETVCNKPMFRTAVRTGRVLVPMTGYYEWSGAAGSKTPWSIRARGADAFLVAAIAEEWVDPDGVRELTYAILTTSPAPEIEHIHDRMPVILEGDLAHAWLETPPQGTAELVAAVRAPRADIPMDAWAVSRAVNTVGNDGPQLVEPAVRDTLF